MTVVTVVEIVTVVTVVTVATVVRPGAALFHRERGQEAQANLSDQVE